MSSAERSRLRLIVHSDYVCPWCYNASVRLRKLEHEFPDDVEVVWRSYLLRPQEKSFPDRDAALLQFVRYTQSWMRPAAEEDAGTFRVWETNEGPPTSSLPAHQVAKAAAELGPEAFHAMHDRLLHAYFAENRDVSSEAVLRELWASCELPEADFERALDPAIRERVADEHRDAIERGMTGVPSVYLEGNDAFIIGAQPMELYRRWVLRHLPEGEAAGGT